MSGINEEKRNEEILQIYCSMLSSGKGSCFEDEPYSEATLKGLATRAIAAQKILQNCIKTE